MDDRQLVIRRDIIEEYWLEFLTFIKAEREEQQRQLEKRQEAYRQALADSGPATLPVYHEGEHLTNRYYHLGIDSFWEWYIEHKL